MKNIWQNLLETEFAMTLPISISVDMMVETAAYPISQLTTVSFAIASMETSHTTLQVVVRTPLGLETAFVMTSQMCPNVDTMQEIAVWKIR